MKEIILRFTLFLLFTQSLYSQKCTDFNEGTFDAYFDGFKYEVEKHGNFQFEKMVEFGVVYLYKTEKISECVNLLKRYKTLEVGQLGQPNMKDVIEVTINKIEDGKLFYNAHLVGTEIILDGYFIKKSDEISDDFKKILEKEQ